MSELYDKLKNYWNGKLGKYGDELVREHAKELKAYSIASISDIIDHLEQNKFRLETYGKTSWSKFLNIAKLSEYLRPGYITDALAITTHQPAMGQGEFLFVSCFKNIAINSESGDLIDTSTKEKIEFKGNRSSFSGESKANIKFKTLDDKEMDDNKVMNDNVMYSICSLFDIVENSKGSFDREFCKMIDGKLKEQPEMIDKVINICQNIKPESHTITKMFTQLYKEKEDLYHVVAAMHCYTYLKLQKTNWLVVTNDSGFAIFKAPEDAEDAWSIVKQLKLGTWGKGNKSIEISL